MKFVKVKMLFISIMVLLSTVIPATTANALMEQYTTQRIGGQTRFDTAIEISKEFVAKTKKPVDSVILCTGYGYADSVSATPFAVYVNAPILLTDKDTLTSATQARISEMNVKKVYVIGGTGVISDNVVTTLNNMGLSVERIAGNNRFDTNRLILEKIPLTLWGKTPKFINGYDVFSGLIVSVDTIDNDDTNKINPVVLIDKNPTDDYSISSQYIKTLSTNLYNIYGDKLHPYISINGTFLWLPDVNHNQIHSEMLNYCTSSSSESKLDSNTYPAGDNHYFSSNFVSHPYATNSVLITTGLNYIDAISAGPLSAITYSPIVFRLPGDNNNSYSSFKTDYQDVTNIYYIGGTVVVPDGSESILK